MSSAIVLPPLTSWAEQHLRALITAKTQDDFDRAFDSFLAKDVKIVFNGKEQTREEYKKTLQSETFDEEGAVVKVLNSVQAPELGAEDTNQLGVAGLFYDATYVEGIRIRDAAVEHSVQSSLNIDVKIDESIPLPHLPAGIRGFSDRRRVFALNQVYVDLRGDITSNARCMSHTPQMS